MKKIKNLICLALAVLSLSMLGAWAPANAASAETRYADAQFYSTYATETVTFDKKESEVQYNSAPHYSALNGMTNACGAVAGSEVIGYYDKYYPNMIPGWESFYSASGKYKLQDSVYIPGVMNELYTLMRINVGGSGVTESNFINGLTKYITGKGYAVGMHSVLSGTSVDFDLCKIAICNNMVIALLSRATDVYIVDEGTTQDSISTITISDTHIMIASGYQEIKYYKNGSLFRTDRYLIVSSGSKNIGTVFYKLNNHKLDGAYIVNIV